MPGQRANLNKIYLLYIVVIAIAGLYSCLLTGCATEYNVTTKQEEYLLVSPAKEAKLGNTISKAIEKKYKVITEDKIQKRITTIGEKIAAVCDRQDVVYIFNVLENKEPNAVSLPGGYVYLNSGLIDMADSDDEIACIIAHEIGHITAKHAVKRLQSSLGYTLLHILLTTAGTDNRFRKGMNLALNSIFSSYARKDELLADRLSVKYSRKAGYNPEAMISFLEKLSKYEKKLPRKRKSYFRTHPYIPERIAVVKEEIYGIIDFEDYINK